jgi:hypothetical protein
MNYGRKTTYDMNEKFNKEVEIFNKTSRNLENEKLNKSNKKKSQQEASSID